MKSRRRFLVLSALLLAAGWGAVSCAQSASTTANPSASSPANSSSADPVELTVSVAASVQDAMNDVQAAYQAEMPNVAIVYNFGSSGALAQQIAQGAPVDVYLSAAPEWMDDLEEQDQIVEDSRQDLLLNTLVLIAPKDSADVTSFDDLVANQVKKVAIGEPESVPVGQYAKEALTSMNLFNLLQPKLVFGKDVRQVLSYVETGNVEAGLVYVTDAQISDQVKVIEPVPTEAYSPIVYPVAVMLNSENAAAAQEFVDFLSADEAIAIFKKYGFTIAE